MWSYVSENALTESVRSNSMARLGAPNDLRLYCRAWFSWP